MTQAPYSWSLTGSCPACGSPIYGRLHQPGRWAMSSNPEANDAMMQEQPEARRTCPASCPHGAKAPIPDPYKA